MDDASKAGQILHDASSLVFTAGSLFIYLAVAFTISAEVTLITILPAAAILLFSKSIYAQVRRYADSLIATEKEVAHHINEHLGGAKAIKSLAAEEGATKGAFARIEKITGLEMRMVFYKLLSASFFEPMSLILIAFVFLYSYQRPGFDFGSFVVAIYLIQKIFGYLQTMQAKFQNINRYIPSLQTVLRYRELVSAHAEPNPGNRTFAFNNALRFENASFGYGDKAPTLSGVSFTVNKGEEVGIIGPSGSGKTTIADLLLRLFNPTSGMITMDGKDIAEIRLDEWRKNVGYVSQDVFLLNDTIENNIRFYDEGVGRDAVVEAARLANILDAVERFPKGLETIVGERGVKLSGGERQRIALARVLARKPSVLILDEATSALDNESELLIQKTLESLRGKTTVITIAHRISTIQNADSVIALDQGKVLEQGSPQDLLKDEDSYFKKMRLMSSK
jgi:subfamily B ATP-binding cassette protein MsbA